MGPESAKPKPPARPDSTIDLVRRAKKGEENALSQLFARYYPKVQAVVRRRLGEHLRRHLESGDILQEAFAQAAKDFDKFERHNENSLINYLAKIAERKIFDALKEHSAQKRNARKEAHYDDTDRVVEFPDATAPLVDVVSASEMSGVLRGCIEELSSEQQDSIVLRYFCHLTFEQIAEATGRPSRDAARMFHVAAIQALEEKLRRGGSSTLDIRPD